ncbi:Exoenzyme S synthesis regulatory protein ExsA [compost metagenome]
MSPTRYVLQRRIRHAQLLLKTTGLTLAAIAHECGFASQAHFTGAFKAATGTTPAKFRQVILS